eukprot:COSAG05_NODE_2077_length_3603_cov_18.751712_2_plen_39_part_00
MAEIIYLPIHMVARMADYMATHPYRENSYIYYTGWYYL